MSYTRKSKSLLVKIDDYAFDIYYVEHMRETKSGTEVYFKNKSSIVVKASINDIIETARWASL